PDRSPPTGSQTTLLASGSEPCRPATVCPDPPVAISPSKRMPSMLTRFEITSRRLRRGRSPRLHCPHLPPTPARRGAQSRPTRPACAYPSGSFLSVAVAPRSTVPTSAHLSCRRQTRTQRALREVQPQAPT